MEQSDEKHEKHVPIEPPNCFGYRHVQALLLFFMVAIAYGMRSSMSVAIMPMTDKNATNSDFEVFNWNSEERSYVLSSLLWGCLVTQIPIGHYTSNHGIKTILVVGFLICGLASILTPIMAMKAGWVGVVCCRVIIGMSQGCVSPSVQKILANWAPLDERARLGGFVVNAAQLGTVLYMPLTSFLATSSIGWPGAFYIFGAISICWSILFYFMGADTPAEHPKICPKEVHYIQSSLGQLDKSEENEELKFPWAQVIKSVPVWSLLVVSCGQAFCYYCLLSELPSFMKYILNFDIEKSGQVSALPYLAMWILGFPISWLSDVALRKGIPLTLVRKIVNTVAMWGPGLSLVLLCLLQTNDVIVYISLFIITVGFNSGVTCGFEINPMELTPNFAGSLVSITNTAAKVFGLLSPIVTGQVIRNKYDVDQWKTVFYITAGVYFVTNMIFILFGSATKQSWNERQTMEPPVFISETGRLSVVSITYPTQRKKHEKTEKY